MNLTTTAILLMSLSTLNFTPPESQGVSTQILPLSIASATPEVAVIHATDKADESDEDCDIVDVAVSS